MTDSSAALGTKLLLASQSPARRALLEAACVPHEAVAPGVDEETMKAALKADGVDARGLADALAEFKATKLSLRHPQRLVLGCDQLLVLDDGTLFDKPADRREAAQQLCRLRGQTHRLISAAVVCHGGVAVWRHIDSAKLRMRDFSDVFLQTYLDAEWPAIEGCVGGYRLEGLGAQLFARIDGSHFTILGLPLLPLLEWLRVREVIAA